MKLSRQQRNELYLTHGMPRTGYEHLERHQRRTIDSLIAKGLLSFDSEDKLVRTAEGQAERDKRRRKLKINGEFVDWKTSDEMGWPSEVFTFLFKRWNIDVAKRLLRDSPREARYVETDSIEKGLARQMPTGKGRWSMTLGIHVDWKAARQGVANGHSIDLTVPLIAIVDEGHGVIIDGHHRAAMAVLANVELLPVVVLEADEEKRARC